MFESFFRHRKYKKMIKVSASFILEEFAQIVNEAVERFEGEGQLKGSEKKEVLKFEATALIFSLFQKTRIFPETVHKLLLDEVHNQYYERLKKHGYDSNMRQIVCDDLNLRYKTYTEAMDSDQNLSRVGARFASFLSARSKTELDIKDAMISVFLIEKLTPKFDSFRAMMKQ